ncbi:MAG: PTS sugar transporter subunit IIA [Proteobacteria bacterium]|nr:PTS sugar transporter subunit IIA [Pseudomonadota bacterium]
MHLSSLFSTDCIYIDSNSQSKTAVLLKISQILSQNLPFLDAESLFDAYWKRESLGSTTIGHGITIPHIRVKGLVKPKACLLKLVNPVDFCAEDKQPVDLVIGLIVPEEKPEEHLKLLAAIIQRFRIASFRCNCRKANNKDYLYKLLTNEEQEEEAALNF